jgi:hypothetical protein
MAKGSKKKSEAAKVAHVARRARAADGQPGAVASIDNPSSEVQSIAVGEKHAQQLLNVRTEHNTKLNDLRHTIWVGTREREKSDRDHTRVVKALHAQIRLLRIHVSRSAQAGSPNLVGTQTTQRVIVEADPVAENEETIQERIDAAVAAAVAISTIGGQKGTTPSCSEPIALGGKQRVRVINGDTATTASKNRYWREASNDLTAVLRATFGKACLQGSSADSTQERLIATSRVIGMFKHFFNEHPLLWDDLLREKRVQVGVEEAAIKAIRQHWDRVALSIFMQCELAESAYQILINLLSSVWDSGTCDFERLKLPHGTPMCTLVCKNMVKLRQSALATKLGLQVSAAPPNNSPQCTPMQGKAMQCNAVLGFA